MGIVRHRLYGYSLLQECSRTRCKGKRHLLIHEEKGKVKK